MNEEDEFEIIDHTADLGIKAYGKTLEETFSTAARAMFGLIAKDDNIEEKETREIEIEDEDETFLFKKWLEELLFIFDTEKLVFSKFDIKIEKKNNLYSLKAKLYGEKFNPSKHGSGVEIKAVTYHMLEVGKIGDKYFAQVIFDV